MPRINITPVVLNLIIINVLVFIGLNVFREVLEQYCLLFKLDLIFDRPNFITEYGLPVGFKPVQLVTSFFSHQDLFHIFLNMFALVSFGPTLETVIGPKRFLIAYLVAGLGGTVLTAFFDPSDDPVLGASGAIAGMLVIFAAYFPQTKVGFMFLPFRFTMRNFVIGFAALSAVLIIVGATTNNNVGGISHFGHLAGMVAAFAYLHIGKLRKTLKR
jgi:membrane associated rhomboid family serine protease